MVLQSKSNHPVNSCSGSFVVISFTGGPLLVRVLLFLPIFSGLVLTNTISHLGSRQIAVLTIVLLFASLPTLTAYSRNMSFYAYEQTDVAGGTFLVSYSHVKAVYALFEYIVPQSGTETYNLEGPVQNIFQLSSFAVGLHAGVYYFSNTNSPAIFLSSQRSLLGTWTELGSAGLTLWQDAIWNLSSQAVVYSSHQEVAYYAS